MTNAHRLRERFHQRIVRELTLQCPAPETVGGMFIAAWGEATIRDLEYVAAHLDEIAGALAEHLTAEVERLAAILVPDEFRRAALDARDARDLLVTGWPFPRWWPPTALGDHNWNLNIALLPWDEIYWHPNAAPAAVAAWLRERAGDREAANKIAKELDRGTNPGMVGHVENWDTATPWTGLRWTAAGISLLFAAYMDAKSSQRVLTIRHGATREARAVLDVFTTGGGSAVDSRPWDAGIGSGWAELVWGDRRKGPVQLTLTGMVDPDPTWRMIAGILDELKHDGLRDWLILHRMAQEQGANGTIHWTWSDHKRAATYRRQIARGAGEAKLAQDVVQRIVRLKNAELHVRTQVGERQAWQRIGPFGLLDIPAGVDEFTKAGRSTRMALIQINPEIYKGALRGSPRPHFMQIAGDVLGMPGPRLALLTMLSCDWQYDREPEGVRRKLGTLLSYAGIRDGGYTPIKHLAAATRTLERHLDALTRDGHAGGYTKDQDGASVIYQIRPSRWWVDRALLDVPPDYGRSLAEVPRTGGELRVWRTRAGRSQRAVAEMLGVSPRTIMRAEKRANAPLSDRLLAAIRGGGT